MVDKEFEGMPPNVEIWLTSRQQCIALYKIVKSAEMYWKGYENMEEELKEVIDLIKYELGVR
jgi:hypothetical protein